MSATGVVETTAQQIRMLGIPHRRLLAKDERTLRVHHKHDGFVFNTDVTLTPDDVYDLAVYKIDMRLHVHGRFNPVYGEVVAERHYRGVYWDQLSELVGYVAPGSSGRRDPAC